MLSCHLPRAWDNSKYLRAEISSNLPFYFHGHTAFGPNSTSPLSKEIQSCSNVKIGSQGTCWKSVAERELDCTLWWHQGHHQCIWFFSHLDTGKHHIPEAQLGLESGLNPWNMRGVLCCPSPRPCVSVCVFSLLRPWWLETIADTGLTECGNSLEFWAPTSGTAALRR